MATIPSVRVICHRRSSQSSQRWSSFNTLSLVTMTMASTIAGIESSESVTMPATRSVAPRR